jgi:hypothetical protein
VDHLVQSLQLRQLHFDPVRRAHHLPPEPTAGLGNGTGLLPDHDHDILSLLGQPAHRLQGAGDIVLQPIDEGADLLHLA